jgi:hypothetical protein
MLTRTRFLTALAATASLCPLALPAAAELPAVPKVMTEQSVPPPSFRAEIESYVREVNERVRTTLNEDLKRELGQKVVIGGNELRTRG